MAQAKRSLYVETHAGWRAFFLCLLIAAILGCGFRLYFSPARLKAWVTAALDKQKATMAHPFALSFSDVSLRLSDSTGYLPQLAVVVGGVKIAPNPDCHPEASVFIGELRLPFRLIPLLSGRAAIGTIGARDITVDLDGLRTRCETTVSNPLAQPKASQSQPPTSNKNANRDSNGNSKQSVWWSPDQFTTVRSFVEGLEFSRATLQFENKAKEIYLDSFSAQFRSDGRVLVKTEIRIPPPVTFGEQIPALKIDGEATSEKANLEVTARVSEGALATSAVLTPGANETLEIDATMGVKSLPLSMLSPFMRKAGLVNDRFQPKFMWLDCTAHIAGPFQGLFQTSPLSLNNCRIEGDATDIRVSEALRAPQGDWKPFTVQVVSLDLAKLFQTAGVRGPEGVAEDFGKLIGDVRVEAKDEARFKGQLKNARLYFSNRKVRASQRIERADVAISMVGDKVKASVDHVAFANGSLDGLATFEIDRSLRKGNVDVDFRNLKFDPEVQKVLIDGELGAMDGSLKAKIEESHLTDFESKVRVLGTSAVDFEFPTMTARAERKGEAPPHVTIEAPNLNVKRDSKLFSSLAPAFFAHEMQDGLNLSQPHLELFILGGGDLEWTRARATAERGQIVLTSSGSMDRDHRVNGWLQIDYPKIKRLKWNLTGVLNAPVLNGASDELTQLKARAEVDDKVLGIQ